MSKKSAIYSSYLFFRRIRLASMRALVARSLPLAVLVAAQAAERRACEYRPSAIEASWYRGRRSGAICEVAIPQLAQAA
eukprot:28306-Prymnesium_polylepis.1